MTAACLVIDAVDFIQKGTDHPKQRLAFVFPIFDFDQPDCFFKLLKTSDDILRKTIIVVLGIF